MAKKKKKNFLVQGSILAFAGIISQVIGLIYRIPLINIIGSEGMGYYNVAFSIYTVALMLTSYSLPLAVSKLVSARIAERKFKEANRMFKCALSFAIIAGGFMTVIIYFGSDFIASKIMSMPKSTYALSVLAPCIVIVSILGVMRGFFQGNESMIPTAMSQVLEQIINAITSIVAAYFLFRIGFAYYDKSKDPLGMAAAYAAAGGTLGTLAGALTSLVILVLIYYAFRSVWRRRVKNDRHRLTQKKADSYRILMSTIGPVILSATVYNITDFIDSGLFSNIMHWQGNDRGGYASLLGMMGGQYNTLINVPIAFAAALGSSLIPSLTRSIHEKNKKQIRNKIQTVTRFNMSIAIPCAVGFIVLAKPIMDLLFFTEDNVIPGRMLQIGGISVVFFCLSTVTNNVLQSFDDMMTPVKTGAIALLIHVVSLIIMLTVFQWNIYGVIISKIIFAGSICILNSHAIRRKIGYYQETRRTFIIPIISAVIMGIVAGFTHFFCILFINPIIATLISLIFAVITYIIAILLLGGLTKDEIYEMPKGEKLVKIFTKLHLLH
ncbi:MAG: polysaccharide biosynthesis protein [Lachnospiraceae bacterium]|jgi:stage V sporulation protein B|nr:polysaccharide biosynthesis protein [Lachnospiraceae bacterium]